MHAPYAAAALVLAASSFAAAATFRGWWRHEHPRPVGTLDLAALVLAAVGGTLAGLAVVFHVHLLSHPYPAAIGAIAFTAAALALAARAR